MKQFIHHVLNKTPTEYEVFKFDIYLFWCEFNSVSQKDLQQLIASQILYDWYIKQLNLLENEFINKVSNATTLNNTVPYLNGVYIGTVGKISNIYPKKLLIEIRKTARKERFENGFTLEHYAGKPLNLN